MITFLLILIYIIAGSFICMVWLQDHGARQNGWWKLTWVFVPGAVVGIFIMGLIAGIVRKKGK
jgi:RsiW-degrading membrane proteinase PrsW (M82 family)